MNCTPFTALCCTAFALCISTSSIAVELPEINKRTILDDWQQFCVNAVCSNRFVEPLRTDADATTAPALASIKAESDQSVIDNLASTSSLKGKVVFTQGYRSVQSDTVDIAIDKEIIKLNGNIKYREPGLLLAGDRATLNHKDNYFHIEHAEYLYYKNQLHGSASSIQRSGGNAIDIADATYTSCNPENESWLLHAKHIEINELTGRAIAKGVRLEVANIPILYTPYFNFITDDRRASGLLNPKLGLSTNEGLQYQQPIYWNVSSNQDMTITPAIITKRGAAIQLEHRYLTSQTYTQSNFSVTSKDRLSEQFKDNRWSGHVQHRGSGQFNKAFNYRSRINFQKVSDYEYFQDWSFDNWQNESDQTSNQQSAEFSALTDHWVFGIAVEGYQDLSSLNLNNYRQLPALSANGYYHFKKGSLHAEVNAKHEWRKFSHTDDQVIGSEINFQRAKDNTWVTGERANIGWSIKVEQRQSWGYLNAQAGLEYINYKLDQPLFWADNNEAEPTSLAPDASVNAGLIFERTLKNGLIQTLEPRIMYLYRKVKQQDHLPNFTTDWASESYEQLFSRNDFVGGDRLEDANRVTVGISSSTFNQKSGYEVLRLSAGQRFYLKYRTSHLNAALAQGITDPSQFNLATAEYNYAAYGQAQALQLKEKQSPMVAEALFSPNKTWRFETQLFYNRHKNNSQLSNDQQHTSLPRYNGAIRFNGSKGNKASISYSKNSNVYQHSRFDITQDQNDSIVKQNIRQIGLSGSLALGNNWHVDVKAKRDIENERNLEKLVGVSYKGCCWNLSLGYRNKMQRVGQLGNLALPLRSDWTIVFGFEFVGLGGVGSTSADLINKRW